MKQSMSWLDIKVWLKEQEQLIIGSYIDNVYMIENAIVLRLRCRDGVYRNLVIEPAKRISFTKHEVKRIGVTDRRQTLWRQLLRDCFIEHVEQLDNERVLFFKLRCGSKKRMLVVELLPRGVALVLDEDEKIILTTESREMKDRVIKPGVKYVPPPMSSLDLENLEFVKNAISKGKDVIRGFIKGLNTPPEVAETVLISCNISFDRKPESLNESELRCLVDELRRFVQKVLEEPRPCIVLKDNLLHGFYPFIPPHFVRLGYCIKEYQNFNDAIDDYFSQLLEQQIVQKRIAEVEAEMSKLMKSIEDIDKYVEARKKELQELNRVLEAISAHFPKVEEVYECVRRVLSEFGWDRIVELCHVNSYDRNRGIVIIQLDDTRIELDIKRRPIDMYNTLRKKVAELELTISRALEERGRLLRQVEELRNRIEIEKRSTIISFRRSSEWYERFHWMITSTGFLVLGGRDASQNIALLRRYAEPHDIVIHADVHGASTIIIKTHGKEVDEQTLREAAVLAACYSKAWKMGIGAVDVFWVRREQISFSAPSGEYLPKGSYMVYGKRNYIRNVKLELAIGIEIVDNSYRIIVGPENLVSKRTSIYMVLIPGDVDPSTIAREFIEALSKNEKYRALAKAINPNEIAMRIPGKSKIVKLYIA